MHGQNGSHGFHGLHRLRSLRRRSRALLAAMACTSVLLVAGCTSGSEPAAIAVSADAGAASTTPADTSASTTASTSESTSGTTSTTRPPTAGGAVPASNGTTVDVVDPDNEEFCAIFVKLAEQRESKDGFARNPDEASWDRNIDTVERIAAAAPDEISAQADTYVQMVIERKALAASYDYGEVPENVKLDFGKAHAGMQKQVNELLAYAKANCPGFT